MRRLIGELLDALVDLANERLVSCALRCMGIIRRHVSPPSVVEHSLRRESASDELAGIRLASNKGGRERRTAATVKSTVAQIAPIEGKALPRGPFSNARNAFRQPGDGA